MQPFVSLSLDQTQLLSFFYGKISNYFLAPASFFFKDRIIAVSVVCTRASFKKKLLTHTLTLMFVVGLNLTAEVTIRSVRSLNNVPV